LRKCKEIYGRTPDTNLDVVLCLDLGQVTLGVGEAVGVKSKRTPLVALHPEAIEMEYPDITVSGSHAFQEAGDGLRIIRSEKGC